MRSLSATTVIFILLISPGLVGAQNCCSPSVSQQGVLGETTALPHTLEISFHYEYLRSRGKYEGANKIEDPENTKTDWDRMTVSAAYGIVPRLSAAVVFPYVWKEKSRYLPPDYDLLLEKAAEGIGDLIFLIRLSPLERTFVNYREFSIGLGIKAPTGSVDRRAAGFPILRELQPGTGSWDYLGSLSFYQGYEPVDFIVGATYLLTTEHVSSKRDNYKFGNQLSYQLTANFHPTSRFDISAGFSGIVNGKDRVLGRSINSTGRHQVWFVPGVHFQAIPEVMRLQAFFELPVYQYFNGQQLGSDFNLHFAASFSIPFAGEDIEDE